MHILIIHVKKKKKVVGGFVIDMLSVLCKK